jgi:hypothetical protein
MLIQLSSYFVVLSCFALPLAQRSGLSEPELAGLNTTNLVLCSLLAFVLLVTSQGSLHLVRLGLLTYLVGNLIVIGVVFVADGAIGTGEPVEVSSEKNIFVLSFDGLSGSAVNEILRREDELATGLPGFVVFDSVASSSPATSASIAAELSGNQNFKEFAASTEQLWDSVADNLLTNVLIDSGYSVTTYGTYGKELNGEGVRIRYSVLPGSTVSHVIAVAWSRTLTPIVARGQIGTFVEGLLPSEANRGHDELKHRIQQSHSPSWDKNLTFSVFDFEDVVDSLRVGQDEPAAFFFHFTHTHYPVEWTASCEFSGDDEEWYRSHQNRAGVLGESTCAVKQFIRFIDRLRSLGVFDRSLIVLKSDHGKPVSYAPQGTIEALSINGNELWGMSRYAPFLAVRPEGATGGLRFDSAPVLLDDLARTICQEAKIDYECIRYPGFNILREGHEIGPDERVTAFVVPSAEADYRFDSHVAVDFTRGDGVFTSMYEVLLARTMVEEIPVKIHSAG